MPKFEAKNGAEGGPKGPENIPSLPKETPEAAAARQKRFAELAARETEAAGEAAKISRSLHDGSSSMAPAGAKAEPAAPAKRGFFGWMKGLFSRPPEAMSKAEFKATMAAGRAGAKAEKLVTAQQRAQEAAEAQAALKPDDRLALSKEGTAIASAQRASAKADARLEATRIMQGTEGVSVQELRAAGLKGPSMAELATAGLRKAGEAARTAKATGVAAAEGLASDWEKTKKRMGSRVETAKAAGKAVGGALESAAGAVGKSASYLREQARRGPTVEEAVEASVGYVEKQLVGTGGLVERAVQAAGPVVDVMGNAADAFLSSPDKIARKASDIADVVSMTARANYEKAKQAAQPRWESTKETASAIASYDIGKAAGDAFEEAMDSIYAKAKPVAKKSWEVTKTAGKVGGAIAISPLIGTAAAAVGGYRLGKAAYETGTAKGKELASSAKKRVGEAKRKVGAAAEAAMEGGAGRLATGLEKMAARARALEARNAPAEVEDEAIVESIPSREEKEEPGEGVSAREYNSTSKNLQQMAETDPVSYAKTVTAIGRFLSQRGPKPAGFETWTREDFDLLQFELSDIQADREKAVND